MNVMDRFAALKGKIELLKNQAGNKDEVNTLNEHIKQLSDLMTPLAGTVGNISFLREQGISVELPDPAIQFARANLQKLAAGFGKKAHSQTFRKGDQWVKVQETLGSLGKTVPAAAKQAWQQWVMNRAAADTPDELRQQAAPTTENKAAIAKYEAIYNQLWARVKILPDNDSVFAEIDLDIAALKAARAGIDFNVPDAVRWFFDSMSSGMTPLMTPEVYAEVYNWLKQKNQLSLYHIARSRWSSV